MGFTLVIILAVADTCYSVTSFMSDLYPDLVLTYMDLFQTLFFFSMHFSIIWSCAIAYLVYRSLRDKNFESKMLVLKVLIFILSLSVGIVAS